MDITIKDASNLTPTQRLSALQAAAMHITRRVKLSQHTYEVNGVLVHVRRKKTVVAKIVQMT